MDYRPLRHRYCYPAAMITFSRYMLTALAVLVLATVFTVCTEGVCSTCVTCCVQADSADSPRTVPGRVHAACNVCGAARGAVTATTSEYRVVSPGALILPAAPSTGVIPLRI